MSKTNITYSAFTTKIKGIPARLETKTTIEANNSSIETPAIWDTGASGTCISKEVVTSLGLKPIGMQEIHTPSGKDLVRLFMVDIILPNNVMVKDVVACETNIGQQQIGALIGLDIICNGSFALSRTQDGVMFSFITPPATPIDFVKKVQLKNQVGMSHNKKKK